MEKITLTKREYLGKGYKYTLINNETKETEIFFCSKEEYEAILSGVNPKKNGFTFLNGQGGIILVDSPSKLLEENSFTLIGGEYFICVFNDKFNLLSTTEISEEELNSKYIWQ